MKGDDYMEVLNDFGKWTFKDKEVADKFDSHVVQSVPFYNVFHDMIVTFSRYFIMDGTNAIDLGTSTGHLLHKIQQANLCKDSKFYGIDYSEEMIDKAKQFYPELNFLNSDLTKEGSLDGYGKVTFVSSMLCLQFINPNYRDFILHNIYSNMENGGAFVIVEKIKSTNVDLHDIYNNKYWEFKRESGISDKEIVDKNFSLQGQMFPLTMESNIEHLKKAGFKTVEVFMKYNNFVGIIAIK